MKKIVSIVAAVAAIVFAASCTNKQEAVVKEAKAAAVELVKAQTPGALDTVLVNISKGLKAVKADSVLTAAYTNTLKEAVPADSVCACAVKGVAAQYANARVSGTKEEKIAALEKDKDARSIFDIIGVLPVYSDAYEDAIYDNGVTLKALEKYESKNGIVLPVETVDEEEEVEEEEVPEVESAVEEAVEAVEEKVGDVAEGLAAEAEKVADEVLAEAEPDVVPFVLVQTKPVFAQGDFTKWVNSNIVYPEAAKDAGTQGTVRVGFDVNKDGSVSNVVVLKSVSPELDAEAVRVVSSSPKWTPGSNDGNPVNVSYVIPIIYKLI